MRKNQILGFAFTLVLLALAARPTEATTVLFSSPDYDRWMYPFNFTPGTRSTAPSFGALGSSTAGDGFDDRDGQVFAAFNTAAKGVTTGLPLASYNVNKVTVTATVSNDQSFAYDPTFDAVSTYQAGSVDGDLGRPIELYGVGFRGGFTGVEFVPAPGSPTLLAEGDAFSALPPGGFAEETRRAFAIDVGTGAPRDVSNNVRDGFEVMPFDIGEANVAPGALVPGNTTFTFDLDLTDPFLLAYVQAGLSAGNLGFIVSSLHPASQAGGPGYPIWYQREFPGGGLPFTLEIELTEGPASAAMPEPATLRLLGFAALALLRRRRV